MINMQNHVNRTVLLGLFFTCLNGVLALGAGSAVSPKTREGLRDVKAPVDFPGSNLWAVMILVGVIISGLLALAYFLRKRKLAAHLVPEVKLSSWEKAYAQLNDLERSSLLSQRLYKEYYSRLSDIIRRYFEDRFQIRAPEMTTEEFLRFLDGSRELTDGQRLTLKDFMNSCDAVKFAKYIPGLKEAGESYALARRLVDQTREAGDQTLSQAA